MRLLWIILFFFSFGAHAQRPFSRDFWLNDVQSPVSVNAMAEASSGYIWVGTDEGLYRFNGRDFFMLRDSVKKPVTAVAAVGDEVYIGFADGGLAKVSHDNIIKIKAGNRGPKTMIRNIYSDGRGMLWLSTEEGIFVYTNGRYFNINESHGLANNFIYQLAFEKNSSILAGTDNGISKIDFSNGKPTIARYGTQQGLPDNIVNVVKIVSPSCAWIGTHEGGVARLKFDKNELKGLTTCRNVWKWGEVNDIFPLSENEAWAVTEKGHLLHLDFKDSISIKPYYFEGKKIRKLLLIKSGNIWCATNEGITIVTVAHATYTIVGIPYFFSTLTAVACEGNNRLWLGQGRELLSMPIPGDSASPTHEAMLPADITCMHVQKDNGLWIGTFGGGLWHYANRQLKQVKDIDGAYKDNILSVTSYRGHLWVASLNGLDELEVNGSEIHLLKRHNKASGTGSDYIYYLYNHLDKQLWLATDGAGVAMYDDDGFHRWDSSSGMLAKVVYSISVDKYGNAWAGTADMGLLKYDGKRWQTFTTNNGLQDVNITSVTSNATGQTLVVTQKGVDEWFPQSNLFRRFNKKTNLEIERISTVLNCVAKDAAGNLYVPFDRGFILFTNVANKVDLRPDISINDVSVFFNPVYEDADFGHDENQLTFHFEGINYSNIERLHYRYKLEGFNNDWIYTNDESITFSQLPAGKFNFRVEASLDKDFEEANEVNYPFEIHAPFWKTPWFLVFSICVLFGLIYLYVKLREKGLRKVTRLQEERMRFEYEHLKSQVNPHFLFNSLNTLSSLIEEDTGKAVDYTTQLSDLYRAVLSYKNMDLIKLSEEMEIIYNYMYIQQTRFGDALRLEIDIPDDIKESRKVIPLALQILVENAIKHNVVSRKDPLIIYITADNEQITVKNDLRPKISKEKGEGLGLANIQRRYSLITKKYITYTISNNQYIVSLPLL